MSKLIRLSWKVEQQHVEVFTEDEWADWVEHTFRGEVDADDLDAVYEELDMDSIRANEALQELASNSNWCDSGDTSLIDLYEDNT